MDSFLITLVVIVIAALSNWLQQKAQDQGQGRPGKPRPDQPPRPRMPVPRGAQPRPEGRPIPETSLERELRRLLGEDIPEPPPRPPVEERELPPVHTPAPPLAGPAVPPLVSTTTTPLPAAWRESDSAYTHAQHLHATVAERLRQIDDKTEKHGRPLVSMPAPVHAPRAVAPIFAIRNNPGAARQAFVASLIFGKPKALED